MAELKISPLAPEHFPDMPAIAGLSMATAATGMKYKNRDDLLLMLWEPGTELAGVFTKSATSGAPVRWSQTVLASGQGRALIVNAGNANAFSGIAGTKAVETYTEALATTLEISQQDILTASTGVIGEPIDPDQLSAHFKTLKSHLGRTSWQAAAKAICTTDTYPKGATAHCMLDGKQITISGIAKGSGMIAPDMATMLSFISTDAAIDRNTLQSCLTTATDKSFNAITVDSDTSTSDTVLLAATGKAGNQVITSADDPDFVIFQNTLLDVMTDLAHQIVRDGEGATKFISIDVRGATSDKSAAIIGKAIANSPLVKTAIAGEDANWGRIVMAVGKAGEPADRDKLSISIGGVQITAFGGPVATYDEAPVAAHMKGQTIDISVDIGLGSGTAKIWTCDLTHDYISINADYRS